MKKLLLVALPAGLIVLGAIMLVNTARSRTETSAAQLERARLKRDFTERASLAKAVPADKPGEWVTEVVALSRWYFDELAAIRNRHPLEAPPAAGVEAAAKERKLKPEEKGALEDFQKYADSRLALLRDGKYAAVASAAAEGLRLDLISVGPGPTPEGAPGLRIDFGLWGSPRWLERERSGDKTVTRGVTAVAFKQIAFRFMDAEGKQYGEMTGGGEPYQKLLDPDRFSDDFPPGVLFGTWWVELFPREAATVQFELAADVREPSGAVRPATFQATVAVPENWKLPPGTAFQGQEREAAPAQ